MEMSVWQPEAIAFLVEHIANRSAGQIASELAKRNLAHKTRNAVCGKIDRLRAKGVLPPSGSKKHYAVDPRANLRRRPKPESITMPRIAKPKPEPPGARIALALALRAIELDGMRAPVADVFECSLVELDNTRCRFPIGDNDRGIAVRFCGMPPAEGRPYCLEHCHRSYHLQQKERA